MHRILEHYGRAGLGTNETVKAATGQCIKTLGEEANIRAGVRRMLATRALVAAARAGVPEAAGALHQGTVGAIESLSAGEHPRGKSSMFDSKTGKTEGGDAAHTDAAARAALGARRRFIAGSEEGDKKAVSAFPVQARSPPRSRHRTTSPRGTRSPWRWPRRRSQVQGARDRARTRHRRRGQAHGGESGKPGGCGRGGRLQGGQGYGAQE